MHLHYLHFCPWSIETIEYLGACRESPLNQSFHSLPHKIPKSKDGARLDKNDYQRTRFAEASDEQKKALLQKKKISKHQQMKDEKKFAKGRQQMRKPGGFNGDTWSLVMSRSPEVQTQNQLQSVFIVIARAITPVLANRIVQISQQRQSNAILAAFLVTIASLVSRRSRKSSEKVESSTDSSNQIP